MALQRQSRNDLDYTDKILAATHGAQVSTLSDHTSERWSDNGGPTWAKVQELVEPGNSRLKSVFDEASAEARQRDGRATSSYSSLDCLYWPVVPKASDRVTKTEYLLRMCYQTTKPTERPYAITGMAVRFD